MNERWAPVAGYEGRYEVSNMGRVRSVSRIIEKSIDMEAYRYFVGVDVS